MDDNTIKTRSYTSASSVPIKTAINQHVIDGIRNHGKIIPIHMQINPTNVCNLNCSFCSCAGRRKNEILPLKTARYIIDRLALIGTRAVTITGGGEPLLYPEIHDLINEFLFNKIKVGLVTNGTQFCNIDAVDLNKITWCRISHSDERPFYEEYCNYLSEVVKSCPDVDFAFSVVVSGGFDSLKFNRVIQCIEFANKHNFTHVRIVPDLYRAHQIDVSYYRDYMRIKHVDDSLVIYQERDNATSGGECYICYLKPYIDADGLVYTCCGGQYALPGDYRSMPPELCLGTIDEFIEKLNNPVPFDGSICRTCYYMGYNELLKSLKTGLNHEDFV